MSAGGDGSRSRKFCGYVLEMMEDDAFLQRVIFSDEATFHLSGKVNRHNVRIWGLQNLHSTLQHERLTEDKRVQCLIPYTGLWTFFFAENTVTGITYLEILEQWLFPQVREDSQEFIFQQDGISTYEAF